MNNSDVVTGLKVHSIEPDNSCFDVNVHDKIKITLNSSINSGTIRGNIIVLEDFNRVYKKISDLNKTENFAVVKGNVSCVDGVITFEPKEAFKADMGYIVVLKDKIESILSKKLDSTFVSCFYTEKEASFKRVKILSPMPGIISDTVPEFKWDNVGAASYEFEVSKINSFEILVFQKRIEAGLEPIISYCPEFNVQDGLYFVHIRAEGGSWSNLTQFFIKTVTDAIVALEDEPIDLNEFMSDIEEPITILEIFPEADTVNISLKLNVMYIKVDGIIPEEDFDFTQSWCHGESFDEDNPDYSHGQVEGSWSVVQDKQESVTYFVFRPVVLDDKTEIDYLETATHRRIEAR